MHVACPSLTALSAPCAHTRVRASFRCRTHCWNVYSRFRRKCFTQASTGTWSSSPKTGLVGPERFEIDSTPGTYFGGAVQTSQPESSVVEFDMGNNDIMSITVTAGSNMLQAAEQAGALVPTREFCFEGSCELCQCIVVGGAQELGKKAQPGPQELIRSCLTAVPRSNHNAVRVQVLSQEQVWADMVL